MNNPNAATLAFRLTSTETALLPVIVALVGIVVTAFVSSIWNHRTLRAAETRYNQDRHDKYTDAIRSAVVDVVHQSLLWEPTLKSCTDRLGTAYDNTTLEDWRELEARTTDMKRSVIAASLIVSDDASKALLNRILKIVVKTEERLDDYARSDDYKEKEHIVADFLLFERPINDDVEALIKRTSEIARARDERSPLQ